MSESQGVWVCLECGNERSFHVVYYDVCELDQLDGDATFSYTSAQSRLDESRILQVGCGTCESVRVGWRHAGSEDAIPGRWVQAASQGEPNAEIAQELLDEVAPSLGVPEARGADGSLQWDLDNPIAGTKTLVSYNRETRTASVYLRAGNAFIGYTALDAITMVLTDLDEGEVEFVAERAGLALAVTADGVFFVRPLSEAR